MRRTPLLGTLPALLALGTSGVLAAARLGVFGETVPGCSPTGGCGTLTSGPLGFVPSTELSWSFVGVVWFAMLTAACIATGSQRPRAWLRWAARIGAFASLGFLGLMAWHSAFCGWCFATHLGSLAAWWLVDGPYRNDPAASAGGVAAEAPRAERRRAKRGAPRSATATPANAAGPTVRDDATRRRQAIAIGAALAAGALASGLLARGELARRDRVAAERAWAMREVAAALGSAIREGNAVQSPTAAGPATDRLAGRRVLGNADSPLRIVVFSDFQCPDCARIDQDVETLLDRAEVAIVPRHFPLCRACNPGMPSELHPDACRRAALAEAAGILGGDAAYRLAHRALFSIQPKRDADPVAVVAEATGLDPAKLVEASSLPEVAEAIARDVSDATALGVTFTPMVFLNGREWKYYAVGGRLVDFVDQLKKDVPSAVVPPSAARKLVDDWLATPRFAGFEEVAARGHLVLDGTPLAGAAPSTDVAPLPELVVWLDYRLPGARTIDAALQELAAEGVPFRYRVMQYPVSESCNPRSGFKGGDARACLAAAAAIAAGDVGGAAGYRAMHGWLLQHSATSDAAGMIAAAVAQGLGREAFVAQFSSGDAVAGARAEADLLNDRMKVSTLPSIVIDGRPVPRWSHPGCEAKEFLRLAIAAAANERGPASDGSSGQ